MGRARVKASTCDVGHRWRGCWDVSVCRRQAGQGPGGAGALGDRWPSRGGTTPASRVRGAGLRPLLTPAQPRHRWTARRWVSGDQKWSLRRAFGLNLWANRCTIVGVFEQLGTAIETLDIPLDGDALTAVIRLRDRLDARISDTIAAYDTASLWELEGATSMTGWLADRGGMARARAAATAARARKLARLSLTPRAWRDGVLSGGQVEAIAANLDTPTLELFAAHEPAVVPALVDLSPRDVTMA